MPQDDENKIFDISKPNQAHPSASSRPVIVGHHPMMTDPMVNKEHPGAHHPQHHDMEIAGGSTAGGIVPITEPADKPPAPHPHGEPHTGIPESQAVDTGLIKPLPAAPPPNYQPDSGFTPIESLLEQDKPSAAAPAHSAHHQTDHAKYDMSHLIGNSPLHSPPHAGPRRNWRKLLTRLLAVVVVLAVAGYLAIDSGAINSSIDLPFHIFKQKTAPAATTPSAQSTTAAIPAGFKQYKLAGASMMVDFPTAWGTPSYSTDLGYSKRGGTNAAAGTYAYLIDFSTNKDVQVAITSAKYLPVARGALYFDFLQWCVGTNDKQFYFNFLHPVTVAGVDTPGTISCDQGPVAGVTKINSSTIVQSQAKSTDNKILGDIYTKNLNSSDTPVIRFKDAVMTNSATIKQALDTVQLLSAGSADSSTSGQ